ncbi:MAG: SDR family oxidoreductase [Bacteroidales bacterium]|nr:SDR family oxidoreductase [Bacteroidales bacterium]
MKQILIVGAGSGIGFALVNHLHKENHRLFVITRQAEKLSHLSGISFVDPDFMNENWFADGLPDRLDGLVYCPGTINLKPIRGLKLADFRNDFEVNVVGAVKVIQAAYKALKASDSASVVLFSTVAVSQGMPFHSSVAAAKGAVEGLARSLAAELAPTIRVNVVAPSLTNTPLAARLLSSDEKIEASAKKHPLQRIGMPDDIANAVVFLLGDGSSWVTGQVLAVDGGLSTLKIG